MSKIKRQSKSVATIRTGRNKPCSESTSRRGAVAVEFAIVAAPLFLFIIVTIEFSRALMAIQTMEEAARAGCREAILKNASTSTINNKVDELMSVAGISSYSVSVTPSNLSTAELRDPVTVNVTAAFADMSWLPTPEYLSSITLRASSTLPKDCPANN